MKRALNFILFLFLMMSFFACGDDYTPEGTFSYQPEKPNQNEKIKIYFNKEGTKLEESENIDLTAYYFGKNLDKVELIPLTSEDEILTATLTPSDSALGILLNFDDGSLVENNNANGFFIQLYGEDGELLPGADASLGVAYSTWGSWYAELDKDREAALNLFNKEFEKNPEVKGGFLNEYFSALKSEKPAEADSLIKEELISIEERGEFTEDDYAVLTNWYLRLDPAKYGEYKNAFREKYPQNDFFQTEKLNEIYTEKEIAKRLELLEEYKNTFPENENLVSAYDITANAYRDAKDFEGALKFLKENQNEVSLYRFYSIGNKAMEENADPKTVKAIAELGVERGREELKNPDPAKKPFYLSDKGWKDETEQLLAYNLLVLGNAENKLENNEEALAYIEEAYQLADSNETDINELYGELLLENGNVEQAMKVMEHSIESGKSTAKIKADLKKAYIAKNGSEENFQEYLSKFESTANRKLTEELQKKMINEPAPQFTLTDLNGEEVSLADYNGKTVVLDFWATWCGPCLQSFPGMKTAVENYDDNDGVKFLFVNTWEKVDDKKSNAKNFIKENNYPFHVLMDEENRVITDYKVTGIPTKFIIDGGGNIRFRSVGYGGNPDQLIEEIDAMIELVN